MTQIESWLTQYETDVRFPDVSGMEHLDMLITRSNIAANKNRLTPEQVNRLLVADEALFQNAERFTRAITAVGELANGAMHGLFHSKSGGSIWTSLLAPLNLRLQRAKTC